MQKDLDDAYLAHYNTKRSHLSRHMQGRTLQEAIIDGLPKREKAKMKPTKKAA